MSEIKEKYMGESALSGQPSRKLGFRLTAAAVERVIRPVVEEALEDIRTQLRSLQVGGIALSGEFGDSTEIGMTQRAITDAFNRMWDLLADKYVDASISVNPNVVYIGKRTVVTVLVSSSVVADSITIIGPQGTELGSISNSSTYSCSYGIENDEVKTDNFFAKVAIGSVVKDLQVGVPTKEFTISACDVNPSQVNAGEPTTVGIVVKTPVKSEIMIYKVVDGFQELIYGPYESSDVLCTYTLEEESPGRVQFLAVATYGSSQATRTTSLTVRDVSLDITEFKASPGSVEVGTPTQVTFSGKVSTPADLSLLSPSGEEIHSVLNASSLSHAVTISNPSAVNLTYTLRAVKGSKSAQRDVTVSVVSPDYAYIGGGMTWEDVVGNSSCRFSEYGKSGSVALRSYYVSNEDDEYLFIAFPDGVEITEVKAGGFYFPYVFVGKEEYGGKTFNIYRSEEQLLADTFNIEVTFK